MIFEEEKGSLELLEVVEELPGLYARLQENAKQCCARRCAFLFTPLKQTLLAEVAKAVAMRRHYWPAVKQGSGIQGMSTQQAKEQGQRRSSVEASLQQQEQDERIADMWRSVWTSYSVQRNFQTVLRSFH